MEVIKGSHPQEPLGRMAVLIPAWQPDEQLVSLVRRLSEFSFRAVIIVNDGSESEYDEIFARAGAMPSVTVLRHDKNCGQGCAVKTAMRHALESLPDLGGIVTCDADGQHAVEDVARVAAETIASGRPVLGVRRFAAGVPLRSRFGNIATQHVFRAFSGLRISDTQSGLRGIPVERLPAMLTIRGERFEFAISVLAELGWLGAPPRQIPIRTIYIDRNRSSHFRPVRDSVRIYLFLLLLYAAQLVPPCVDLAGFVLALAVTHGIGAAMLAGRIGATAAAALLEFFPAARRRDVNYSLAKYIAMLACTGVVSLGAVWALVGWKWNAIAAKIVAEAAIWLLIAMFPKRAWR